MESLDFRTRHHVKQIASKVSLVLAYDYLKFLCYTPWIVEYKLLWLNSNWCDKIETTMVVVMMFLYILK